MQVIDEADRMMDEFKQDWLSQLERAIYKHQEAFGQLPQGASIASQRVSRQQPGPLTAARYTLVVSE